MKNRIFFKYIITYLLLFATPLIISYTLIFQYLISTIRQETMANYEQKLQASQETLDREFIKLHDTAYAISKSRTLLPFTFQKEPLKANDIIELLATYKATNSFIEDIYLVRDYDDYVYTASTTARYDLFFKSITATTNRSPLEMKEYLDHLEYETLWSNYIPGNDSNGNLLSIAFPLSYGNDGMRFGTITFVIRFEVIAAYLQEKSEIDNITAISNRDQELLYLSPGKYDSLTELEHSLQNSKVPVIGGDTYLVNIKNSLVAPVTYSMYSNSRQAMQSLYTAMHFSYISLAFLLLLGFAAIAFAVYFNYQPLKKLYCHVQSVLSISDEKKIYKLSDIEEAVLNIKQKVNSSQIAVQDRMITNMLNGLLDSSQYNVFVSDLHLPPLGDKICCSVFRIKNGNDVKTASQVYEYLRNIQDDNFHTLCHLPLEMNRIILICHTDESVKNLLTFIKGIYLLLSEQMNATVYTGIGNIYNSPLYIKNSYEEASLALESTFMDTKETFIIYRHTVSDVSRVLFRTKKHMDLIENCLLKNDFEKLNSLLERYFEILHEENVSNITARALCINLIIHIYDIVNENSTEDQPVLSSLLPLAFLESFDDLTHEVVNVLESLKKNPAQPTSQYKENSLISDILDRLNCDFANPDLSVQSLADTFHMSPSNICQYFHIQTGSTILTYITQMRMQLACELLKNTSDTIETITVKTGYQNVSSFTRRFKKETGVTPGAYRKLL